MENTSEMDHQGSNNQITNLLALVGSVASFAVSHFTKSNIAWFIGVVAGLVAIVSGILNIIEKRMKIRQMKRHNNFYKDKKGYNGK